MGASPPVLRLEFADVTVVPAERLVLRHGQPVSLAPKAFDLLLVFAENPQRLLMKEQLMQAVWGDTAVEESNLSYHVFSIRKALGDTAENGHLIETVPKRGYRFTAAVTRTGDVNAQQPEPAVALDVEAERAARPIPQQPSGNHNSWRSVAWFAAGVACAAAIAVMYFARTDPAPAVFQKTPGARLASATPFALAPDGQRLVFAGKGPDGVSRLWVLPMDETIPRPLSGSEAVLGALTPPMFWSPDSQAVFFDAAGQLKRFDLRDASMRTVCALPGLAVGGSANAAGEVIVGQPDKGLFRCSVDGRASRLTRLDASNGETAHAFPWFLPDGRHFLYLRVARKAPEGSGVYIGSLDDGPDASRPARLLASGFGAAYVPGTGRSTGHVVFLRDATLYAQPFDERTRLLKGDRIALATPVGSFIDGGFFSASQNDVIVFRPPERDFQLTWHDRQGNRVGTVGEVGRYVNFDISRDDSLVAAARELVGSTTDQDIWILGTSSATSRKVTSDPLLEDHPVWSGTRTVIFTIGGDVGTLFEQAVDGPSSPRMLMGQAPQHRIATSASADGRYLLFTQVNMNRSRSDVWALPLTGDGKAFPIVQRTGEQDQAQFSPDGQLVAYGSDESGRSQVLVQRFVDPSDPRSLAPETLSVSVSGGTAPRWGRGGKELYFMAPDGVMMVAEVLGLAPFSMGVPRELFRIPGSHGDWDVTSDGSRFLIAIPTGADSSSPFTVLLNHLARLRATNRPFPATAS